MRQGVLDEALHNDVTCDSGKLIILVKNLERAEYKKGCRPQTGPGMPEVNNSLTQTTLAGHMPNLCTPAQRIENLIRSPSSTQCLKEVKNP